MRIATPLIAVVFTIFLQPITAMSQEQQYWLQTFPASNVSHPMMVKDAAANLYIVANTTAAGATYTFVLVKYNSAGTLQWNTTYGNANITSIIGIGVDNSQNLYVGINTKLGMSVIKYSLTGQLLWLNQVTNVTGQPYGSAMTVDAAGNSYITGYTITVSPQTLTFKMNSAGVQQWAASYVGTAGIGDNGAAITVDGPGNVYVAGTSQGIGTNADIVTIKYDPYGGRLWAARYNGSGPTAEPASTDSAFGIAVDAVSGNVYTVGKTNFGGTDNVADVVAYSSTGTPLWANQDGSSTADLQVLVDYSGNIITLGVPVYSVVFNATKYTSAGSVVWANGFSPSAGVSTHQFVGALDNSGNLYVTMPIGISNVDYVTMEYSSNGTLDWSLDYNGPANGRDNPTAIAIQSPTRRILHYITFPEIFVTGTADNSTDLTTIMYSAPPILGLSTGTDSLTGQPATFTTPAAQLSNYPNPFHGATTISYTIPGDGHVILQVYDGAGRPIATLVNEDETAGNHTIPFNAGRLAAGIYQCRIIAQSPQSTFTQTKQMIIQ